MEGDRAPLQRAVEAILTDLHRQAKKSGCSTEDNGTRVQVDGSFEVEPIARAVLQAIREPSEAMLDAAREDAWAAGTSIRQHEIDGIFGVMIDAALVGDPGA